MKHDELREKLAQAGASAQIWKDFNQNRWCSKDHPKEWLKSVDAIFAAIRDAGFAILPVVPTKAMLQAGQQERDDNAHVSEIWTAMLKAAQEGAWPDIRGIAPDATGDLSSEDFVRQMRDEWPDKQEGKP
jgi:hypothetical protein